MKKVLIVGIDSDIAKGIKAKHDAAGDRVVTTSRNGIGDYRLELVHPTTWPQFKEEFDILYYCIGIGDSRYSRMEVMQVNAFMANDFLGSVVKYVKPGGTIVGLTTLWGSVSEMATIPIQFATQNVAYKMSRAAFNMGFVILSRRFNAYNWVLMHPGTVRTKATKNLQAQMIDIDTSASGIIKTVDANTKQFVFVDYSGRELKF